MVLAEVTVGVAVGGNGHPNACRQQPVRLTGGVLRHHGKHDFAVVQVFQPLAAGELFDADGRSHEHPGYRADPLVDTVGAGDAFTAALVVGLMKGLPLGRINQNANRLAAYVCTQPGATPPIPADFVAEVTA